MCPFACWQEQTAHPETPRHEYLPRTGLLAQPLQAPSPPVTEPGRRGCRAAGPGLQRGHLSLLPKVTRREAEEPTRWVAGQGLTSPGPAVRP